MTEELTGHRREDRLLAAPGPAVRRRPRAGAVPAIVASVAVSGLGTWSYNVGLAAYAYQETHSTAWIAAATVGRYVPALGITWAGARLTDRLARRTAAVTGDVACALLMVLLTVLAAVHGPLVPAIALAAVSSGVSRLQSSAALALASDVVSESRLVRATALMSTAEAVATAVGPALASIVLVESTAPVLFALNGVSFLLSAGLLSLLPEGRSLPLPAAAAGSSSGYRSAVRAVWPVLASRAVSAVVYGVDVVLLAVVATAQLDGGTSGYGMLLAAAGAGGLLAALVLYRRQGHSRLAATVAVSLTLYALPLLVFLLVPGTAGGLAVQVVRGFGSVALVTVLTAALQQAVPSAASARVFALWHGLQLAGTCVGALAAPLLVAELGLPTTLVLAAVVPWVLQCGLLPALARFDRRRAVTVAALDPTVDVLRRLDLFGEVNRSTLYAVADSLGELEVPAGTVVVGEGEAADALFVLREGSAEVTGSGVDGRELLRRLGAGDYFGELGLLHQVRRTATVTTIEPSRLWRIPADAFLAAVSHAGISDALQENARLRAAVTATRS